MTYWANALVRHTDKDYPRDSWVRPQFTYTPSMSYDEAMKQLEVWRDIYKRDDILMEWIEDGNNKTVWLKCYLDGMGNVRKP